MVDADKWLEKAEKEIGKAIENGEMSENVIKLINGLRIYQSELEMQNEELMQSQEELSRLYIKYHELYDEVPLGYFTLDIDRIIRNVNIKATELLQLNKKDIIGESFSRFIVKDYENIYYSAFSTVINENKTQELELQLKRNKTLFYAYMKIIPIEKGDDESYRIVITDITEQKIEERLIKSRDNLELKVKDHTNKLNLANLYNRSLIEASLDPLVTIGPDGKITDINEATEAVTGYSRDKLIGTDFSDYFTEPEKARDGYQQVFQEGMVLDYPLEIKHKNGHITPVIYNASVYKNENNNVIGVFAAARDITELKKAVKILKDAIYDLERSNKELEQFAHISSHDLQEPLRTIASFTQLLERRYKGHFDSDADEFIDYIVQAAIRMKMQIDGLLEYSRVVTKGKEFEEVDMNKSLNHTLKILNTAISGSDAIITHDELPHVMGDMLQLERVLQNLISNAIKFRKREEPLKIHISACESGDGKEYIFSVADNGIGIEKQYLKHIFTIFQRLHTMDVYEGTGIGLSIVKRIIERHGGDVWVESKFGVGSSFYFTVPSE